MRTRPATAQRICAAIHGADLEEHAHPGEVDLALHPGLAVGTHRPAAANGGVGVEDHVPGQA